MTVDEKLDLLITDISGMKTDISDMKANIKKLENEVMKINITLENVTNRNIKIIAEGHLDLSRKLDEALKVENEKELLLIRVNILENELKQIKDRLSA